MHLNVFELLTSLQYGGILLLSTVFAPELVMPIVGYLAWTGVISIIGGMVAGIIGATLGAVVLYWFARSFKGKALDRLTVRYGSHLSNFSHAGPNDSLKYAVLISRFIPAVRSAMAVPAGLQKMPVATFIIYTAIGNVVWISILTLLGYVANIGYRSVQSSASHAALIAGVVLVALIFGKFMYNRMRTTAHKHGAYT
jgi:membrane protein DedA with SNARE-associated domain